MSAANSRRQRGFSLAEIMVASAIMIIVVVGVLMLYDRANKVFKTGNEAAELQQNVRVAYDRMVADIRMAGFDYKRGGALLPGQSAAPWAPGRAYSNGTIVTPTVPNGNTYRATNGGTSGPSEPGPWPTNTGGTVVETAATPPITWQQNGGAVYEQPDEQIEYAGATALTVRANYDYSAKETGDIENGREPNLQSAQFPVVTTGNSEIVTYGLVSNKAAPGTAPNTQSIVFYADTGVPRRSYPGGSAEDTVTISGVDLTNANPPYTLYRFTLHNTTGAVQSTALADNVRSLNFFYFEDPSGAKPLKDLANHFVQDVGGAGQYDPTVAGSWNATERTLRKKIRAIRVRVVGMNSQIDTNYGDTSTMNGQYSSTDSATGYPLFATDTIAPNFRRLTVDTLIAPRNLGLQGLAQTFLQPPPQPTLTSVCIGYCGIAVVNWKPNTNNPNASYIVEWDTDQHGSYSNSFDAGPSNSYPVDLTQQDLTQTFWFQVRAINAGGTATSTNQLSAMAKNDTKPSPPMSIAASGSPTGGTALSGKIRVSWTAPVSNASGSISCVPSGPTPAVNTYLREIKGFRIFRSTNSNFNAASGNMVLDESASGPTAPQTDGYGNYFWDDTGANSCGVNYYYRIETVEWCAANAAYNTSNNTSLAISSPSTPSIQGTAGTTGTPGIPVNLKAAPLAPTPPPQGMTNSVCTSATNTCNPINLNWVKVTTDLNGNPIGIDAYEIERTQILSGNATGQPVTTTISGVLATAGSTVSYADSADLADPITHVNYTYSYRVRAVQNLPCLSGSFSAAVIFPPPCNFSGSVLLITGATTGDGLTPATAWVMDAGDTIQVTPPPNTSTQFVKAVFQVSDFAGNIVNQQTSFNNGTPANPVLFTWLNQLVNTYVATFTITDNALPQCTEQIVRYIQQQPPPACHITTFDIDSSILHLTAVTDQLQLDLKNTTNADLTMDHIDFQWQTNHSQWNSTVFPSGGSVTGPNVTTNYTMPLSPKPSTLTTNDITIPANGTRSLLFNFSVQGNAPSHIVNVNTMSRICVSYTQVIQGTTVLHCTILPNPSNNNPGSCN